MIRIVCISDTHGHEFPLPAGDILIHAGDLTMNGTKPQLDKVRKWLASYVNQYAGISVVPGNHDWGFEQNTQITQEFYDDGLTVLNDSGCMIDGIRFWGSPVQPWFHDWAFNRTRGEEINKHWVQIPDNTQVLVTHGPPYGILDKVPQENVGCEMLKWHIQHRLINLKLHVFGHIHEQHGSTVYAGTKYVNASILNDRYKPTYHPITVILDIPEPSC